MRTLRSVFALLTVLFLLVAAIGPVTAQEATPVAGEVTILSPDEEYAGVSRSEWDARAWQWVLGFPEEISPGIDPTGERCGLGQNGPVFFLPGNFSPGPASPTCIVPEGMAILLGLGGAGCTTVEPPPFFGRDEAELQTCAEGFTDVPTNISVTINGVEVADPMSYRSTTPAFPVTFPEGNIYGVPAGVSLSVANGFSMLVAPPTPGTYEIVVSSTFAGEPEPFVGTFTVIVQAHQIVEPDASPVASPVASPAT